VKRLGNSGSPSLQSQRPYHRGQFDNLCLGPNAASFGNGLRDPGPGSQDEVLRRSGDEVGELVSGGPHRNCGTEPVLELFTGALLDA
jgi:hypothetical protein